MPFPPVPVPSPRRARAPPAAAERRRPPEGPAGLASSSWPSATLARPPARRGPGPGPDWTQPPGPARAPPQPAPRRAGTPAPRPSPRPGPGPAGALRFPLSLAPEAALGDQRPRRDPQLQAGPRRPPAAAPGRPPAPRARTPGHSPDGRALPRGLPAPPRGPPRPRCRPAPQVSLLNERHRYDDEEYEDEPAAPDEGLVRRCTEWLRGVQSAANARGRAAHLDALPHLSTL